MALRSPFLAAVAVLLLSGCGGRDSSVNQASPATTSLIVTDQFGYLPADEKIAVLRDPQDGFDQAVSYAPGTIEVRKSADNSTVFSPDIRIWRNGQTDAASGDKVWWADFSALTAEGEYYLYDTVRNIRSHTFRIGGDVYKDLLKTAGRTFFYQRASQAKTAPYADSRWSDAASHGQDAAALRMDPDDPETGVPGTARDLSGGWYDAGDFNKYVNYADGAIHDLLFAYEENPGAFGDDWNIPESGNGVADLLDEIRWELAWMLKMQDANGSVLHKVASISWDATPPPSSDTIPRRYGKESQSATISAAGAFAHGAIVFADVNATFAATLESAAEAAWNYLETQSFPATFDNSGFVNAAAEDSSGNQAKNRVSAAVYLFLLTGNSAYHDYVKDHLSDVSLLLDPAENYLMFGNVESELHQTLAYYIADSRADAALKSQIRTAYRDALENPYVAFAPKRNREESADPYMAYLDYHSWGSNRAKCVAGSIAYSALHYGIDDSVDYNATAAGYLHYLHGINPLGKVYLSVTESEGADNPVGEFYHMWFADGSAWDGDGVGPAPGFLVGGPNEDFGSESEEAGVLMDDGTSLMKNQPILKRYKDWNAPGEQSYKITENSITYQAAYIRLLSKFAP